MFEEKKSMNEFLERLLDYLEDDCFGKVEETVKSLGLNERHELLNTVSRWEEWNFDNAWLSYISFSVRFQNCLDVE
jgi:hypothetical protein